MKLYTCYRVLGLSPGASFEEIREAYRKKIKEFHPDVYSGDGRCALLVREAYESLSGKGSWSKDMEALAEELFPGGLSFVFPEFSQKIHEPFAQEEMIDSAEKYVSGGNPSNFVASVSKKKLCQEKDFWKKWIFPKRLLRQEEHMFLVADLLQQSRISLPPVGLEKVASSLGVVLCPKKSEARKDPREYYCRYDGTLSGGTISYESDGSPTITSGHILEPHVFYQRYVVARLLGYFLYYPFRERTVMVGDFLSFFSRYDEEEINTHRFAEELLLPQSLFSVYGGKVLWYMEKGRKFSYENFLKKTSQLFQAPQPVVEHRARKFERRIRLVGTMNREGKGRTLLKEIENLFQ